MISCGCNSDHVTTVVTRTTSDPTSSDSTLTGGLMSAGDPDEFIGSSATLRENDERYIHRRLLCSTRLLSCSYCDAHAAIEVDLRLMLRGHPTPSHMPQRAQPTCETIGPFKSSQSVARAGIKVK